MLRYLAKITICDSFPVFFRKLSPHDRDFIKVGFESLSFQSKCLRFISPPNKLSEKWLRYMTEIDHINHVAIIAFGTYNKNKVGIAVARYIRLQSEPDIAEIAIIVHDKFQNNGIGTMLLSLLIENAIKNNLKGLRGYVLSENYPMLNILKKYHIKKSRENGSLLKVDILI